VIAAVAERGFVGDDNVIKTFAARADELFGVMHWREQSTALLKHGETGDEIHAKDGAKKAAAQDKLATNGKFVLTT
jgi:hypothetical protein